MQDHGDQERRHSPEERKKEIHAFQAEVVEAYVHQLDASTAKLDQRLGGSGDVSDLTESTTWPRTREGVRSGEKYEEYVDFDVESGTLVSITSKIDPQSGKKEVSMYAINSLARITRDEMTQMSHTQRPHANDILSALDGKTDMNAAIYLMSPVAVTYTASHDRYYIRHTREGLGHADTVIVVGMKPEDPLSRGVEITESSPLYFREGERTITPFVADTIYKYTQTVDPENPLATMSVRLRKTNPSFQEVTSNTDSQEFTSYERDPQTNDGVIHAAWTTAGYRIQGEVRAKETVRRQEVIERLLDQPEPLTYEDVKERYKEIAKRVLQVTPASVGAKAHLSVARATTTP